MAGNSVHDAKEGEDLDSLHDYLKNGDIEEKMDSAKALGVLGYEESRSHLIEALEDDSALVRANAALALGQIGGKEVVDHILEVLKDDSWEVRHDAVIALGEVGGEKAVKGLAELLEEEEEFEIKEKTIYSLGKIGDKEAVEVMEGFIDEEELHQTLARSLCSIDDEVAEEPLIRLFEEGDRDTRMIVVEGLGAMERSDVILDTLYEGLKDDIWRVREESAKALGRSGDENTVEKLLDLLDDENSYVVEACLKSVGKLGDGSVVDEISEKLDDQEASIRIASAEALGEIGKEKAVDQLLGRLEVEDNPRVLWSISDALSECEEESVDKLRDEMEEQVDERKYALAVAMGKLGDKKCIASLLDGLKDNRWKIRQKSVEGLENIDLNQVSKKDRRSVLSNLRDKLEDDDKWVRERAVKVLYKKISELEEEHDVEKEKGSLEEREKIETDLDVRDVLEDVVKEMNEIDE
ncbi:MAG: HEAT repeat domain-containing protein [Thermoplasmatota archaeon]